MKNTVPLKKNFEFIRAFKKGRFYAGRYMILYAVPNNTSRNRLGITASRKVGKSVRRNRIRRLIRENYRSLEDFISTGFDIVLVARNNEAIPGFLDIKKELKYLLKKLSLFDQEKWDCLKSV